MECAVLGFTGKCGQCMIIKFLKLIIILLCGFLIACKPGINSLETKELFDKNSQKIECVLLIRKLPQWGPTYSAPIWRRLTGKNTSSFVAGLFKYSDREFLQLPVTDRRNLEDRRIYYVFITYQPCEDTIRKVRNIHKSKFGVSAVMSEVSLETYLAAYQGQFYLSEENILKHL